MSLYIDSLKIQIPYFGIMALNASIMTILVIWCSIGGKDEEVGTAVETGRIQFYVLYYTR